MEHQAVYIAQQALNAAQLAAFYVPLAIAFALIQAVTRKVFLSFGEIAMFGSFASVYLCFYGLVNGADDLQAAGVSLAVAFCCTAALGFAVNRFVFAPLLQSSAQSYMIGAVGTSIVLQEVMRLESQGRDVWIPPLFQGQYLALWPPPHLLQISATNGFAQGLSLVVIILTGVILKLTSFGRNWQACAQDMRLAGLCGVNTIAVLSLTFMMGAGLSSVSGWIAAITYGGTSFSSGLMLGFKAMFAAVIGGFGSLKGAVMGALSLSALEVIWSALFSSTWRDVGVFGVIILVLILRPEGLAGSAAARESEPL